MNERYRRNVDLKDGFANTMAKIAMNRIVSTNLLSIALVYWEWILKICEQN